MISQIGSVGTKFFAIKAKSSDWTQLFVNQEYARAMFRSKETATGTDIQAAESGFLFYDLKAAELGLLFDVSETVLHSG